MLRFVCNLPATAVALGLARLTGSRPVVSEDLFMCCARVPRWLNGPRGGMTVGNVYLTSGGEPAPDLRRHEVRHADQWALLGPVAFPILYGVAELVARLRGKGPRANLFERWAGLSEGGYVPPAG
ncbi:MAG TPA: hypothetical protein VKI20_02435 [Acidimicrobiales bacterium]|nr:hypothetical protein [Acidimicrobiales bacterium]